MCLNGVTPLSGVKKFHRVCYLVGCGCCVLLLHHWRAAPPGMRDGVAAAPIDGAGEFRYGAVWRGAPPPTSEAKIRARARRRFPRRLTSADKSPYCPYSYRNMGTARIANRMSRRRASENRPSMESGDRRYQSDSMVFGVAIPCAACPRFQSVDKAPASPNIRMRSRGGFLQKPGRA